MHGSLEDFFALFPELEYVEKAEHVMSVEQAGNVYKFMLFDLPPPRKNIMLNGTWQAYQYCAHTNLFPNWRNALKDKYDTILEEAGLNNMDARKNTWMIHFRHGDYKSLPHHQIPMSKYYTKCIYEIPAGARLIAYSDEPELSQEFLESIVEGRQITVVWSKLTRDIEVLHEMSHCLGGFITANSTFSWWGAFYAKRRAVDIGHKMDVFYPSVWGQGLPDPTDLIPSWGVKVMVE